MTREKEKLLEALRDLFRGCEGNVIREEEALPGCAGLVLYEEPLFGVSAADDPIWQTFRGADVIGDNFLLPGDWLPGAASVVSFYLPFSERVRSSNRGDSGNTSPEWLHARIEGQTFINEYTKRIRAFFEERGESACVPALDPRFAVRTTPLPEGDPKGVHIASNWSERHVAFASGLGTFCLTRGLISRKGVAGRYGSVIVTEAIEPDARAYTDVYEWCARCGACIRRCPAGRSPWKAERTRSGAGRTYRARRPGTAPDTGAGSARSAFPASMGSRAAGRARKRPAIHETFVNSGHFAANQPAKTLS